MFAMDFKVKVILAHYIPKYNKKTKRKFVFI